MVAAIALAGGACGGDDDAAGSGEWCDLARDLESNTLFDEIDVDDPESVESAYRGVVDILDDAADSAPDEIKADVETVLASTEELVEALEDVDFDFTAIDESVLGDLETVDASDRIEEYGERVCGIAAAEDGDGTNGSDVSDFDDSAVRDQLVGQFETLGMTEDQARCLIDNMDLEDLAASGDQVDPSMFAHLFSTCGIDLDPDTGG
jgi:hypothetical protein